MSILKQEAKVLVRIGEPKAKKGLVQEIPCVFVIPNGEAPDSLLVPLHDALEGAALHMVNPHLQGGHPVEDEDEPPKYLVLFWAKGETDAIQNEHFKKGPALKLENVRLGRYTAYQMSDYEGSVGITMKLEHPIVSDSLAGKVDKLAGTTMIIQVAPPQTKIEGM